MSRTRYGRVTKSSLERFTEFDGANITTGYPEAIMDCDKGNPRIRELMDKIKKNPGTVKKRPTLRKDPSVNAEKGRVRVELKLKEKMNNKTKVRFFFSNWLNLIKRKINLKKKINIPSSLILFSQL